MKLEFWLSPFQKPSNLTEVTRKIGVCVVLAVLFKKMVIGGSALCAMRIEPRKAMEYFTPVWEKMNNLVWSPLFISFDIPCVRKKTSVNQGFQTNCYSWRKAFIPAAETACHRKCLFLGVWQLWKLQHPAWYHTSGALPFVSMNVMNIRQVYKHLACFFFPQCCPYVFHCIGANSGCLLISASRSIRSILSTFYIFLLIDTVFDPHWS